MVAREGLGGKDFVMQSGPFTYLWLVLKTAFRHSLHATHSIILVLIIVAGVVTSTVPQVEVLVDLHGWQVALVVLALIIGVRLLMAPYWIWKDEQSRLAVLSNQVADKGQYEQRLAAKSMALDDIAQEIEWAVNNLVNPKPHPGNMADPETAIPAFEVMFSNWCGRVSKKLANRDVFTQGDQTHFDALGFVPVINVWAHPKLNPVLSQLQLKIERLREIEHRVRERK
jgi:hypothetical protein